MKKLFLLLITGIFLLNSACFSLKEEKHQAKLTDKTLMFGKTKVELYEFPNGFKVAISENKNAPVLNYSLVYKVGAKQEERGQSGLAHMLEHLMFKGTAEYPSDKLNNTILKIGGKYFNATTNQDTTKYTVSIPSQYLEEVIKIDADRMRNLIFTDKMLETEKQIVLSERTMSIEDNPDGKMYEQLLLTAFKKHPYRITTIGKADDIKKYTFQDVRDYYRTYYAPNNAFLILVGDIDTNKALSLVDKYIGGIPPSKIPAGSNTRVEPEQNGERVRKLWIDVNKIKFYSAYHIPRSTDPDFPAITLLDALLSSGKNALLKKKLYDTGLGYSSSWIGKYIDPHLFAIEATVLQKGKWNEVTEIIDGIISDLQKNTIDREVLNRILNIYKTGFYSSLESNSGVLSLIQEAIIYAGKLDAINIYWENINSVEPDDIKRVATKYLTKNNRTMIYAFPRR